MSRRKKFKTTPLDVGYADVMQDLNYYNENYDKLKSIELTEEIYNSYIGLVNTTYAKDEDTIKKIIIVKYQKAINKAERERIIDERNNRLYGKIKNVDGNFYKVAHKHKKTALDTTVIKVVRELEVKILTDLVTWKKTYKYNIIDELVNVISKCRTSLISALEIDKEYVDIKYQYYMESSCYLTTIEYILSVLFFNLQIITTDEMSSYVKLLNDLIYNINNLMNGLAVNIKNNK